MDIERDGSTSSALRSPHSEFFRTLRVHDEPIGIRSITRSVVEMWFAEQPGGHGFPAQDDRAARPRGPSGPIMAGRDRSHDGDAARLSNGSRSMEIAGMASEVMGRGWVSGIDVMGMHSSRMPARHDGLRTGSPHLSVGAGPPPERVAAPVPCCHCHAHGRPSRPRRAVSRLARASRVAAVLMGQPGRIRRRRGQAMGARPRPKISETTNSTRNRKNSTWAMEAAVPASPPKPSTAAIRRDHQESQSPAQHGSVLSTRVRGNGQGDVSRLAEKCHLIVDSSKRGAKASLERLRG